MTYYTGVGSRATPSDICAKITEIAKEKNEQGLILRSGAAHGADTAFEDGAGEQKEIWLPWLRFNGHTSRLVPSSKAIALVSRYHPAAEHLSPGALLLHARNIHQVLGADLKSPSKFLICWTPGGRITGGTATALRVADEYKIPIINLGAR